MRAKIAKCIVFLFAASAALNFFVGAHFVIAKETSDQSGKLDDFDYQKQLIEYLNDYSVFVTNWINNPGEFGALPSATHVGFPAVLLSRSKDQSNKEEFLEPICSGTIISSSSFLTAAHCFCPKLDNPNPDYYNNFDKCTKEKPYNSIEYLLYSPHFGIIKTKKNIYIHRDYNNPLLSDQLTIEKLPLADLAIIEIQATSAPLAILGSYESSLRKHTVFVGAGPFKYVDEFMPSVIKTDVKYGPAVIMTAKSPLFRNEKEYCRTSFSDVFCAGSDGIPVAHPPDSDFIVCNGDSGGGVFQKTRERKFRLVGVLSSVDNYGGECSSEANGRSIFTNLDNYIDWITKNRIHLSFNKTQKTEKCFDAITRSGRYKIQLEKMRIVVKSLRESNTQHADSIEVHDHKNNKSCQIKYNIGILHCESDENKVVDYTVHSDGAQLVICNFE